MRRLIAFVLVLAGFFLLALAGAVRFWAAGQLSIMPINLYVTMEMKGNATYLDFGSGTTKTSPVTSTLTLRGDVKASSANVAVLDMSTVTQTTSGTVLQATTERIALNRRTAHTVNCCGESVNNVPVRHEGWGFVFPPDTKKQDYPLWDSNSKQALPAHYRSTRRVGGHETYEFSQDIAAHQVASQPGAGPLVGEPTTFAVPIWAASRSTLAIEPTTGQPLAIELHIKTTMRDASNTDAVTVFAADLAMNDTGKGSPARTVGTQLRAIGIARLWGPLIAVLVAVALIGTGVRLHRRPTAGQGTG